MKIPLQILGGLSLIAGVFAALVMLTIGLRLGFSVELVGLAVAYALGGVATAVLLFAIAEILERLERLEAKR